MATSRGGCPRRQGEGLQPLESAFALTQHAVGADGDGTIWWLTENKTWDIKDQPAGRREGGARQLEPSASPVSAASTRRIGTPIPTSNLDESYLERCNYLAQAHCLRISAERGHARRLWLNENRSSGNRPCRASRETFRRRGIPRAEACAHGGPSGVRARGESDGIQAQSSGPRHSDAEVRDSCGVRHRARQNWSTFPACSVIPRPPSVSSASGAPPHWRPTSTCTRYQVDLGYFYR